MDSVKVSDEVTSTTSLVSRACGGVGSVRVLPQKCRDVRVRHPFEGICGVSSVYFFMGCSILCARKSVWWCFYGPLGRHTLRASLPLVCRPCRASSRDISHGTHITAVRLQALPFMILCHIARQARHFSKNFFTGFWDAYFGMLCGFAFSGWGGVCLID